MVLSLGTYQSIEIPDPEGIPRFENCSFIHFNYEITRPTNTKNVYSTFRYNGYLSVYIQK